MNRRHALLLGLLPLALGACGFQLRQPVKLGFSSLQYNGPGTPVGQELRRTLQASGVRTDLAPVPSPTSAAAADAPPRATAEVILDVLVDQRERVVVGQTAAGQVRELQLRQRFQFRLRTADGRELIASEELLQTRDISFTETAVLGKEAEEVLMFKDMQSDIVQQVMRRLAATRMAP